jgi:hypothetical protein
MKPIEAEDSEAQLPLTTENELFSINMAIKKHNKEILLLIWNMHPATWHDNHLEEILKTLKEQDQNEWIVELMNTDTSKRIFRHCNLARRKQLLEISLQKVKDTSIADLRNVLLQTPYGIHRYDQIEDGQDRKRILNDLTKNDIVDYYLLGEGKVVLDEFKKATGAQRQKLSNMAMQLNDAKVETVEEEFIEPLFNAIRDQKVDEVRKLLI